MGKKRKRELRIIWVAIFALVAVCTVVFWRLEIEHEKSETNNSDVETKSAMQQVVNQELDEQAEAERLELERQRAEAERLELERQQAEEERLELERQQAEAEVELTKALEEIVQGMTIEEKVGQMFFIRANGGVPQEVFDNYHVGGILLFGMDFQGKTPETLVEYIQGFQDKSAYPLLIGTDEEGGTVSRISGNNELTAEVFQSPKSLYEENGFDAIEKDAHVKSQLLLSYGINVNFAPVCDLAFDPDDFMYKRSFGTNVSETCQYIELVVQTMEEENIGSVLKHFPGYGNNGDTHTSIITDDRELSEFETNDFLPFSSGIKAGADCVMVSHNIVTAIDTEYPASLSLKVHTILREELGFVGVIITDDLVMEGVTKYVGAETAAILAVQAGNDMILSSDYQVQYRTILNAVEEGTISEKQIDEAVLRILRWKYNLGLLEDFNLR